MHKEYFEGIIQLRNPNDEAINHLEKALGNEISRVKKVRNGLDFYIKNNKNAQNAAKEMNKRFGGDFNVARKLFSKNRQTSKEVYRLSILVRLPEFSRKDIIKIGDELIKINGLAKKITGTNIKTGKKVVKKYPEDFEILKKYETRVVKVRPQVEVLHPETFQSEILLNKSEKNLVINEKVKVILDNGIYVV